MPTEKPTVQQIVAFNLLKKSLSSATPTTIGNILRQAGFAESVALTPKKVTDSQGFKALMEQHYNKEKRIAKHKQLLETVKVEHMVFPRAMTDAEITEVIESVPGCKVKKIKHGDQQNHAYFWIPDGGLQLAALDKLYKVTGDYAPEKIETNDARIDEALDQLKELLP